jgi:hypothetical protein
VRAFFGLLRHALLRAVLAAGTAVRSSGRRGSAPRSIRRSCLAPRRCLRSGRRRDDGYAAVGGVRSSVRGVVVAHGGCGRFADDSAYSVELRCFAGTGCCQAVSSPCEAAQASPPSARCVWSPSGRSLATEPQQLGKRPLRRAEALADRPDLLSRADRACPRRAQPFASQPAGVVQPQVDLSARRA